MARCYGILYAVFRDVSLSSSGKLVMKSDVDSTDREYQLQPEYNGP